MAVFFDVPGVVSAELNADGFIVVHWQNLALGEVVKACCEAQLSLVERGARVIIVDTATAKWSPPQEIQDWLEEDLFPGLRDAGLVAVITVVPRSAVTRLASRRWNRAGEPYSFDMFEAESLDAAIELAKDIVPPGGGGSASSSGGSNGLAASEPPVESSGVAAG